MAATPLTVTPITRAGIAGALSAANADGHTISNPAERMFLEVVNGGGSSIDVTIDIVPTVDGQSVSDRVVSVPAGERRIIGPFPANIYNNSDGNVTVTFSAVSDVELAAFSI